VGKNVHNESFKDMEEKKKKEEKEKQRMVSIKKTKKKC